MRETDGRVKDAWDKAEIMAKTLGAVLLPLITLWIAYMLNASIQDRASRVRMVELAVEILKSDPNTSTNANYMRGWALEVLQKNSEVPLPKEAVTALRISPLELILPLPTQVNPRPVPVR
jgi:hypothetical protein